MQVTKARVSKKGVPHFIFEVDGKEYSICWMGTGKFYRIFKWGVGNDKIFDIHIEPGSEVELDKIIEQQLIK